MNAIESILTLADAFTKAENIELSTVSWRVFGDTKKLPAMRAGADIQVTRATKALQWFSDHWPNGAEWPSEISRPERSPERIEAAQ